MLSLWLSIEMEKMGISEELINQATGFAETDDQEIIEARKTFKELNDRFKSEDQNRSKRKFLKPAV